jgi:hypothetical protein
MTNIIHPNDSFIPTKFEEPCPDQQSGDVRVLEQWEVLQVKVRDAVEADKEVKGFDYHSTKGEKAAKKYIGNIKRLITEIGVARKAASDVHHKRWKGMIQAEKEMVGPLEALIQPHVNALTAIKEAEEARIRGHRDVIAEFQRFEQRIIREPGKMDRVATTSEEIKDLCGQLRVFAEANPPEEREEFQEEARQALDRAQVFLFHAGMKVKEAEIKQAEEEERQRQKQEQERNEREEQIRAEAAEQARREERRRMAEEQAPPSPPAPPAPRAFDRPPGLPAVPPSPASSQAVGVSAPQPFATPGVADKWRRHLAAELVSAMKGRSIVEIAGLIASDQLHPNVRAFVRSEVFGIRR